MWLSISTLRQVPLFSKQFLKDEFCELRLFGSRKFASGFGGWHHACGGKG